MLNSLRLLAGLGRVAPKKHPGKTQPESTSHRALAHRAVSGALIAELEARIDACYRQAEAVLQQSFPRPLVSLALRGRSAGTAHLQQNRLRFNPVLLAENATQFIDEVVPHEICHLLCYRLYGRVKPHGKEWQSLMRNLYGLAPSTTHKFDTSSVKQADFGYLCGCGEVRLSLRRHNKVLRGQTQYRCKLCHEVLSPQQE